MKKIISIAAFLFLLVSSLSVNAGTKPKDVYGWDKLRWGMTEEEVIPILGKDVKKRNTRHDEKDNMYSSLQLRKIEIADNEFRASLWMDSDTKKLRRIVFFPEGQPEKYEWAKMFIETENFLVKKYGPPSIEKTSNDPGTSADRIWMFPTTEIELSYLSLEGSELLLLVFSQTEKVSI
ncbi:MAG: hypothetical protein WBC96_04810, partial [Thermodesulfobacteriota bacterium]